MEKRRSRAGNSIVEVSLLLPWIFFLFVGSLDFGFYAYALIAAQSAARVAVLYTSSSASKAADTTGACSYALAELLKCPNVGAGLTTCTAAPVQVTAAATTGADGQPSSTVTVVYQTIPLIPIPGVLAKQWSITRSATMKVWGS